MTRCNSLADPASGALQPWFVVRLRMVGLISVSSHYFFCPGLINGCYQFFDPARSTSSHRFFSHRVGSSHCLISKIGPIVMGGSKNLLSKNSCQTRASCCMINTTFEPYGESKRTDIEFSPTFFDNTRYDTKHPGTDPGAYGKSHPVRASMDV